MKTLPLKNNLRKSSLRLFFSLLLAGSTLLGVSPNLVSASVINANKSFSNNSIINHIDGNGIDISLQNLESDSYYKGTSPQTADPVSISIDAAAKNEPDNGQTGAIVFRVTLSAPAPAGGVLFTYGTSNGTASTSDNDFTQTSGTKKINEGGMSSYIVVPIIGDNYLELDETFSVGISSSDAIVSDGHATGTIINNDAAPSIQISDGDPTVEPLDHEFSVCFSGYTKVTATVDYATANDSAIAGSDYTSINGTLSFNNGDPCEIISINIAHDPYYEPTEKYYVNLSNPVNAVISDGQGEGIISNDDDPPTISISDLTITEGSSGNLTVSLSRQSGYDTGFSYRMIAGSALAGSDYTSSTSQMTIGAGSTTATIPVSTLADSLYEADETFTVQLYGVSRANVADSDGLVTITDDDSIPTISITDETIREGSMGEFTISLSAPSGLDTSFDYFTSPETAQENIDYDAISGSLTIPAGDTSTVLQVVARIDAVADPAETFHLNLNNVVGATPTATDGTGTIIAPALTISDAQATEGDGMIFTVSLSAPTESDVPFTYTTADGTAYEPTDYTSVSSGSGTITAGDLSTTISVNTVDDLIYEPVKYFLVNINSSASVDITDSQGSGVIMDDDATADISVTITGDTPDPVLTGENLTYEINVANSGLDTADIVVFNATLPGGVTFVSLSATGWTCSHPVVGANGTISCSYPSLAIMEQSILFLTVNVPDDVVTGSVINQTFTVSSNAADNNLSNNTATEGTTVQALPLTITDAASSITYSNAALNGRVNPLGSSASAVFEYGLTTSYGAEIPASTPGAGTSYATISAGLSGLTPGTTYHYRVRANNAYGTTYGGDATFTTSSIPTISIADSSQTEGDSGTTTLSFAITLSDVAPAGGVTFDVATADNTAFTGSDYSGFNLTGQTIAAGDTTYNLDVLINGDMAVENDESFYVNISNVTGATINDGQGLGTIRDDDTAGITVSPTSGLTTTEGGGTDTFTVVLDSQPTADVSISLSSSDVAEGTVSPSSLLFTIADWNVAQTVTVSGVDDAIDDGDNNYSIIISSAVSSDSLYNGLDPADVIVTNLDNDGPEATLNTEIHNASHASITSAAIGTQVHASTTVNGNSFQNATGEVIFRYYHNVSCSGNAAGSETVLLDASGAADMTTFAIMTADGLSFRPHYNGDSNYPAEDGDCEAISTSDYPIVLVSSVNTIPKDLEDLSTGISSISLQFNRDVMHDSSGNPDSVTNPANYILVESGVNQIFDTTSCSTGVSGDDGEITVNSISYDASTYRAMLNINNGARLTDGEYRLFVCGTTSILSADGTVYLNNHASDSTIRFSVSISNNADRDPVEVVATGFEAGVITTLPEQPTHLAYAKSEMWIEIPELGIKQPVLGVPKKEKGWDVSWLGDEIGYLQGTAFPTWAGNTVLTGHVTGSDGKPGVFTDLGTLTWGKQIIIHAFGQRYIYEVRSVDLYGAADISQVIDQHEEMPWLTLITCRGFDKNTGQYRWRTVVRAVQVRVEEE